MGFQGVYEVYKAEVGDSDIKWRRAGRFMVSKGRLDILEDYFGTLSQLLTEGPVTGDTNRRLQSLASSSYLHLTKSEPEKPESAKVDPSEPPLVQWREKLPQQHRKPVWDYQRAGMDKPHTVEYTNGDWALDGKSLTEEEKELILENVRSGVATLRYKHSSLGKSEEDMDPATALEHVRNAAKAGTIPPEVERALTRHIYEDKMVPGIGNRYAWNQFAEKKQPGAYVMLDLNHLKHLNDTHGHEAGDAAIQGFGKAIRGTIDDGSLGKENAKAFRTGGDEFIVHAPSYEHAAKFARDLRAKLEAIPAINGVHKISTSLGIGHEPAVADKALYEAKKQKFNRKGELRHAPGQGPVMLAHSLHPGFEGPVASEG